MKSSKNYLKDGMIALLSLMGAFGLSLLFQKIFDVQEHITTVFVFAVFLTSLLTDGYLFGVLSAIISTIAVNYVFTFPYFAIDFVTPVNMISGIIMMVIAIVTCTLTTERKRSQAARAESEKERMRANLLRAVSHDLRTPLTTIYASSTTLLEDGDKLTPQQQLTILNAIKEDSDWLIRMVENLLSVTRLDNGQVKLLKTPTVLEELIDAVIFKFKKRHPQQQVAILLPEEPVLIPMDAILIEQVLVNILENAVQHAVGMTQLTLQVSTRDDQAIFQITDDGCGIPPKRLETLFTSQYASDDRPDGSSTRNAGIGLTVCATIIKAHGGSISAENLLTGGAQFRFTLATEALSDDTE